MAIDSNALSSIRNAIASYSGSGSSYTESLKNQANDSVNSLAQKVASFATKSRYKAAFEEKMKIANESSDTVDISKESLAALKKYNQTEVSAASKKESSSSSGYTYDYQAIRKKNLENIAAIEKEVSEKYGKKTDGTVSADKSSDDAVKSSASADSTTSADKTSSTDKGTDTTKTQSSSTAEKTTSYSYDYTAMKAKDAQTASRIESEVKAQYTGHNSPDDIVN